MPHSLHKICSSCCLQAWAPPPRVPGSAANCHYVTGLTSNRVLQKLAHEVVEQAERAYTHDGGMVTRFHSIRYQVGTWLRLCRVVIKGEVSAQGVNTRCVVTDLEQAAPRGSSGNSTARGQADNEIKDHKRDLK